MDPAPHPAASAAPDEADDTDTFPSPGHADDWEHRVVCPDGSCIGVVGSDGRCSICGRKPTNERSPSPAAPVDPRGDERVGVTAADADETWSQRQLCSDGACLGIIGQNGRCSVCGKVA